jgi:cytochrome c biogenesis protein CcdA
MDNKGNSAIVLVIAFVFILAGIFVAVLTLSGTFEKAGFEFLSAFNTYIFGIIIAVILVFIGLLLLYFGMHGT